MCNYLVTAGRHIGFPTVTVIESHLKSFNITQITFYARIWTILTWIESNCENMTISLPKSVAILNFGLFDYLNISETHLYEFSVSRNPILEVLHVEFGVKLNFYYSKMATGGHFEFGRLATLCTATQMSTQKFIVPCGPLNSNQESNSLPQRVHTGI